MLLPLRRGFAGSGSAPTVCARLRDQGTASPTPVGRSASIAGAFVLAVAGRAPVLERARTWDQANGRSTVLRRPSLPANPAAASVVVPAAHGPGKNVKAFAGALFKVSW